MTSWCSGPYNCCASARESYGVAQHIIRRRNTPSWVKGCSKDSVRAVGCTRSRVQEGDGTGTAYADAMVPANENIGLHGTGLNQGLNHVSAHARNSVQESKESRNRVAHVNFVVICLGTAVLYPISYAVYRQQTAYETAVYC